MNTQTPQQPPLAIAEDEINLADIAKRLWKGKWIILALTLLSGIIGTFVAFSMPNKYTSSSLLTPGQDESQSSMSKMASQYGGLAAMAGIDLGGGSANITDKALALLKSRKFITRFISENDLLPLILAVTNWNDDSNEFVYNTELYDPISKAWNKEKLKGKATPSLMSAYGKFTKEMMSISKDKKTGFTTLSITYLSPILACSINQKIVEELNRTLKQDANQRTQKNIDFLKEQLINTKIADMQNIFYHLIEEQTKSLMLAQASQDYAFQVLDPAVVPEKKSSPKRSLILAVSLIIGIISGCFCVLLIEFVRKNYREA